VKSFASALIFFGIYWRHPVRPITNDNQVTYQFGGFVLDSVRRVLSREDKSIALKPKIFDTLLVLVKNSGRVMDKDELMQEVWPDTIVEEVNLAHNISILRKVLGQKSDENRFIVTVPGRGYGFVAEVTQSRQKTHPELGSDHDAMSSPQDGEAAARLPDLTPASAKQPSNKVVHKSVSKPSIIVIAPVPLVALTIAIVLVSRASRQDPQLSNPIKSIAVLPFKALIVDGHDESLEMGIADTLIARLSNIKQINVRPIGAVRKYAALDQDSVQAGREQRVDAVVDGQIQRSGEKIRVTVRLVRVRDEYILLSSQFDEKITDIFQVEDSISERIAGVLAPQIKGEEKERLTKHYTDDAEAYQLYLIGRFHSNRLTDDGFIKSLDYFQRAVDKDPKFALAYIGMSDAYNSLGGFNVRPPKEVFPKARTAALTALSLDSFLGPAHTQLAIVNLIFDWDWSVADREFQRAIEINPGDSDAHYYYSYYLAFIGQFNNALAEIRKAQELDPVSLVKLTGVAQILLLARQYDQSIQESQRAIEMDPNLGFAHWLLGLAYLYKAIGHHGPYDPAVVELQKSVTLSGDSADEPATLAQAYWMSGKKEEARKILEDLERQSKRRYISTASLANLHGVLGENDRAFALLENAYQEHDGLMVALKVDPYFDRLRTDPRLNEFVERVGFPK